VSDSLLPDALVPRLRGRFGRPYRYEPKTPSTQRLLGVDDPEGAVAVTDHQTEGRGRLGRRWEDAPGTSLLVSLLLRPDVAPDRLPELSPLAGRACADAIAAVTGLETEVKFPNDVLVGGRKVAGVLAEASEGRVVLGIGVNVNQTSEQLPPETPLPTTSLRVEGGTPQDRSELLVELLARLENAVDGWVSETRAG
jgi:BirA family transcriptional regulator, biotin operon repressor / biotin---[acetyl-CoA-carboxylase] ligase